MRTSLATPGVVVEADISTATGPEQLVAAAVAAYGKVDILVNNATVVVSQPLEEQTPAPWDRLVNLNGCGVFLLSKAVLPHITRSFGRIVNIVSTSSRGPPPDQTIYAGTKGMVDSFTRCWAKELPPKYGCTMDAVSPSPTRTEGFSAATEETMKVLQPMIDQTPMAPRLAEASEIACAVAVLCEERARWINGVHLMVTVGSFID